MGFIGERFKLSIRFTFAFFGMFLIKEFFTMLEENTGSGDNAKS